MPSLIQIALPVALSTMTFAAFAPTATADPVEARNKRHAKHTVTLQIKGMVTKDCPELVRKAVEPMEGVVSAKGDLATKTATIEFRADEVSIEEIRWAIKSKAGFESQVLTVDDMK